MYICVQLHKLVNLNEGNGTITIINCAKKKCAPDCKIQECKRRLTVFCLQLKGNMLNQDLH